jgi:hypothetical protein
MADLRPVTGAGSGSIDRVTERKEPADPVWFRSPGPPARKTQRQRTLSTMRHIQIRNQRRKPQRLLYRDGITRDELVRLIAEVGREHVEGVLRALDLPVEPVFTAAE